VIIIPLTETLLLYSRLTLSGALA